MYETKVKIDGMMCGMCESHINDAIRNAFSVKKVSASHSKGEADIISEEPIDEAKLRRAGLTYWHQTDIVTYESWEEFLEKNAGSRMILMTSHATKLHSQFQFEDGDYIVFGREDAGVPDAVHAQFGERQFRIPMIPSEEARCFNLATSVGIVLMEAERQLGYPGLV